MYLMTENSKKSVRMLDSNDKVVEFIHNNHNKKAKASKNSDIVHLSLNISICQPKNHSTQF